MFCVFIGHERQKLFSGIFIPSIKLATSWENLFMLYTNNKGADQPAHLVTRLKCFRSDFLANVLKKGLFLTSTTQMAPIFNGGNCRFDVFFFYIRLQAISRISMRNRSVYDGLVGFSILLMLFSEGTSAPLRKHMWATMDQPYVKLSCQFQFVLLKAFSIHPDLSTKYWFLP